MSGFMFGGSALTLDVGVLNNSGAPVTEGMILSLDMDGAPGQGEGFRAQLPVVAGANPEMLVTVVGAALVPTGQVVRNGEALTVRVVGPCKVRVDANAQNIAVGDLLQLQNGSPDLVTTAAQPDVLTPPTNADDAGGRNSRVAASVSLQIAARSKAIARGAATTDNFLVDAWMSGLPG